MIQKMYRLLLTLLAIFMKMNKFLVVEVHDNKWSEIVNKSKSHDFYHTQSYHLLEKDNRPILFVMEFGSDFVGIPLIIRKIPNTCYFDCTSVYGYCGPISNLDIDAIPQQCIESFQTALESFFVSNSIVTAFSRLHPLISCGGLFREFGVVKNINQTVAIDLRMTAEEQKKQYRKSNKSELNQLRRKGFEVVEGCSRKDLDVFVSIYHETMTRVDATQNYFFDHKYFYDFLDSKCFLNKLLLAKKDEIIVAGAIFTISNTMMQYHLAGTRKEFIKETPMKLILVEDRLLGNNLGLEFFHLGGGVGGSDDDSLFRFKSGFSDYRCQFKVWNYIADQELYNVLCKDKDANSSFFPLYRS